MKVGSQRKPKGGGYFDMATDMATDIELIARKIGLTLHEKIYNELKSAMQAYALKNCFEKRMSLKLHECNLVFLDYE